MTILHEGSLSGDHLEQHHTEGIYVGSRIVGIAEQLLGSHVGKRAHEHAGLRHPADGFVVREQDGQPEVENLRATVSSENHVAGLQVAMKDAMPVCVVERVRDRRADR
jgi:hypothetical protein